MSLPKESADDGALTRVREWNIKVAEPDPDSAASRLVKQCVAVFKKVLKCMSKIPQIPTDLFHRFERCYSSLALWDVGYGIGRGTLDESMARSRTLRRSILEPLVSISRTIIDRLIPRLDLGDAGTGACSLLEGVAAEAKLGLHEGYNDDSDSNESDSNTFVSESCDWGDVAEDLWTDVRCLVDLALLIKSPAPDSIDPSRDDVQKIAALKPHSPYIGKIKARFPTAEETLIDRLASANLVRYRENKVAREANHAPQEAGLGIGVDLSCAESVSKFHDSGMGTSINTSIQYAETIMSYRREGQKSLSIPPLSAEAKRGKSFDCIACGKTMHITNNSAWKKHLYLDLRPWICHEPACNYSSELFTDRESWTRHLALGHGMEPEWRSFQCPLCHGATGSGRSVISQHLSAHLEEISLAALPLDVDSDNEDDSDDKSASDGSEEVDGEHFFRAVEEESEKRWFRQEDKDGWRCLAPGCNLLFKAKPHFDEHVKNGHSDFLDSKAPTSCLRVTPERSEASAEPPYGDKTDATATEITTSGIEGENKPLDGSPTVRVQDSPSPLSSSRPQSRRSHRIQVAVENNRIATLEDLDRHIDEANPHLRATLDLQHHPSLTQPLIPPIRNPPNVEPFNVGRAEAKEDSDHPGVTSKNTSTVKPQLVKQKKGAAPPRKCQSCNRINIPEWRRGPDGARTLCNACGLHYAKLERKQQLEARANRPKPKEDVIP